MQIKKLASLPSRTGRDLQKYNQGCRQVVGCIPYRIRKTNQSPSVHGDRIEDIEVLLISSQKSPRMMFPKGGWETDENIKQAALRETIEEAGVVGKVGNLLGNWKYESKSQDACHEGFMFPMLVTEELEIWPEKDARQRIWMKASEAKEACFHPWMKEALNVLLGKLEAVEARKAPSLELLRKVESGLSEPLTTCSSESLRTAESRLNGTCLLEFLRAEEPRMSIVGSIVGQSGDEGLLPS